MNKKPIISLIAAIDQSNLIGKGGTLPWRLPADLAYFKSQTMSKPIVMGRKTFDSIGRPLPGRLNVIISHQNDLIIDRCLIFQTVDEVLSNCGESVEIMVIGGRQIYELFLPFAQKLYLTEIQATFAGDTYFPKFDKRQWQEVSRVHNQADTQNPYDFDFVIYERKPSF